MKYRSILFDADGMTLISKRFSEQIQDEYGIAWEKMKPFFGDPFLRCRLGQADLKDELSKVMGEWGWKGTVDELIAYWLTVGNIPHPEILELVRELQSLGVKCCLATNQEKYRADYLREVVGLKDVFDELFISSDLGYTKDDPAFFEEVYRRLLVVDGAIPKESVLFADHDEKNLDAARSFGFEVYDYDDVHAFRAFVLGRG